MSETLLADFQEAYRNLQLLPLLEQPMLDRFRVDYGSETLEELKLLVDNSPFGNSNIVFAGHRGSGKSTLLAELSRQLRDRYFVVFFSIAEQIEMSDVNHINILFAIAVCLMKEAEEREIAIEPQIKDNFYQWFATRTRTEIDKRTRKADAGIDLFKTIVAKLQTDNTIRNEIKQEFVRNISELIARINEIASVIQAATQKEIVVIVDDLDKLDLAVVRDIYQAHINALFQPNVRTILTIPISALRDVSLSATLETATNNQIVRLSVAKLFHKGDRRHPDARPIPETAATLREVLRRRIREDLIAPDAAEKIVVYSGGVLRELIRIAIESCRLCLRYLSRDRDLGDLKIDTAIATAAITKLRLDFDTTLGMKEEEMLVATYQNFRPLDPKDPQFLDLLHGLYVLEYRNDELWYDVHPIVTELLQERGLIA